MPDRTKSPYLGRARAVRAWDALDVWLEQTDTKAWVVRDMALVTRADAGETKVSRWASVG
ncbi:hypothetical protein [Streptomyces sp. NPDC058424]|uniref:hypothetical protein n=1 Tax=Streptomyces sp. NPDC058424 TaxID=3346491 RepID=UPI00364F9F34